MEKARWIAIGRIPGIASEGGVVVVVDPDHPGILVSRWVDWSKYPNLMKHGTALRPLDGPPSPSPPSRPASSHLRVI